MNSLNDNSEFEKSGTSHKNDEFKFKYYIDYILLD